jgi:hypothetical protein
MLTLNEIEQVRKHTGNDFATVGTADATPTVIYTLTTSDTTAGFIDYLVIGIVDDGSETIVVKEILNYLNDGTTMTIKNFTKLLTHNDTGLLTADVTTTATGDDIEIEVTGVAATNIEWKIVIQHWSYTVI